MVFLPGQSPSVIRDLGIKAVGFGLLFLCFSVFAFLVQLLSGLLSHFLGVNS